MMIDELIDQVSVQVICSLHKKCLNMPSAANLAVMIKTYSLGDDKVISLTWISFTFCHRVAIHTLTSVQMMRKSYLPIQKDPVLISPFSPQLNPSSSLSRSTQSSHTLCHLSKPRESLATSISHILCIFQSHKNHFDLHLFLCSLTFHDSSTSLFAQNCSHVQNVHPISHVS